MTRLANADPAGPGPDVRWVGTSRVEPVVASIPDQVEGEVPWLFFFDTFGDGSLARRRGFLDFEPPPDVH